MAPLASPPGPQSDAKVGGSKAKGQVQRLVSLLPISELKRVFNLFAPVHNTWCSHLGYGHTTANASSARSNHIERMSGFETAASRV